MNDCIEGNVYHFMIVRIELNSRTEMIIRKRKLMSMTMTIMMSTMVMVMAMAMATMIVMQTGVLKTKIVY